MSEGTQNVSGIEKIAEALAKAQGEMKPAAMDRTNPHFGNKYATLASVWEAIRPVMASNGLSVIQIPGDHQQGLMLTTTLMHTSGQQISSTIVMPLPKKDPQSYGSALTYARRYGLCAMLGVVAEEDDDANGAMPRQGDQRQQQQRPPQRQNNVAPARQQPAPTGTAKPSHQFYRELAGVAAKLGIPSTTATNYIKQSLAEKNIASTDDLTEQQLKAIIGTLSPTCKPEVSKVQELTAYAVFEAATKRNLTEDEANDVIRIVIETVDGGGETLGTMTPEGRKKLIADVAAGQFDPQPA